MSSASVVTHALQVSLGLVVFGVGLEASAADALLLIRQPGLFARSVLSINVIMPLIALCMAIVLSLDPAVELALIAFAMSPVPPFLPLKTAKVGAHASYTVSLLATESVVAIALVPLTLWIFGALFDMSLRVSATLVARIVGTGILLPLAAGIAWRAYRPRVAERMVKPTRVVALILLIGGVTPLLVKLWSPMMSLIGDGTVGGIVAFSIAGVWIGHALGGPLPTERPVLALATATRHPAVAISILGAVFPDERLAPAAVVLVLITASLAALPYVVWSKGQIETKGGGVLIAAPGRRLPMSEPVSQRPATVGPARRRSDRRR
jgi:bile acid:Na+ symporter, BASS family